MIPLTPALSLRWRGIHDGSSPRGEGWERVKLYLPLMIEKCLDNC